MSLLLAWRLPADGRQGIMLKQIGCGAGLASQSSEADLVDFVFQAPGAIHLVRLAQEASGALVLRLPAFVVHRHSFRTSVVGLLLSMDSGRISTSRTFDLIEEVKQQHCG